MPNERLQKILNPVDTESEDGVYIHLDGSGLKRVFIVSPEGSVDEPCEAHFLLGRLMPLLLLMDASIKSGQGEVSVTK